MPSCQNCPGGPQWSQLAHLLRRLSYHSCPQWSQLAHLLQRLSYHSCPQWSQLPTLLSLFHLSQLSPAVATVLAAEAVRTIYFICSQRLPLFLSVQPIIAVLSCYICRCLTPTLLQVSLLSLAVTIVFVPVATTASTITAVLSDGNRLSQGGHNVSTFHSSVLDTA